MRLQRVVGIRLASSVYGLLAAVVFSSGADVRIDLFETYRYHQHMALRLGDSVTWVGRSQDGAHIVESFEGRFQSEPLNELRPEFTFVFHTPGLYHYRVLLFAGPPPYNTESRPWRDLGSIRVCTESNSPPVVIHSPLPGSQFGRVDEFGELRNLTEPIYIIASFTNSLTEIQRVEFYAGGQMIGMATEAPYSFAWKGATFGTHHLTAHSIHRDGSAAVSPAIPVTVREVSSPRSFGAQVLAGGLFAFDYVLPPFLGGNGYFVHISQDARQLGLEIKNAKVSGRYIISMDTNQMQFFRVKERF